MDIKSGNGYPASALSNFAPYRFVVDGVECNSMEGFLQSLKFSGVDMQRHICTLVGKQAKSKGAKKNWKTNQTLYWKGCPIHRDSEAYQNLLDEAYAALAENTKFQKALLATGKATLQHSIGRKKTCDTVLTVREFCGRLTEIRDHLQGKS
ncbi:hypothetical protein VPHD479_0094 [Vibrio phage D479]